MQEPFQQFQEFYIFKSIQIYFFLCLGMGLPNLYCCFSKNCGELGSPNSFFTDVMDVEQESAHLVELYYRTLRGAGMKFIKDINLHPVLVQAVYKLISIFSFILVSDLAICLYDLSVDNTGVMLQYPLPPKAEEALKIEYLSAKLISNIYSEWEC